MTPTNALQILYEAAGHARLPRKDHQVVDKAAELLANWLEAHQGKVEGPATTQGKGKKKG